ncbi:MAG: type II toxin-antitoxin system Phd/YefM family antitoxin [Acidobacteriota bacterium]
MKVVNVHQAKSQLSRLLARVARGEQVVIAKNDKPVAKLVPLGPQERRPGRLKGKIRIRADFDAPLPQELASALRGERD